MVVLYDQFSNPHIMVRAHCQNLTSHFFTAVKTSQFASEEICEYWTQVL